MASFECPECGYQTSKWMGFCPQCRVQQPLVEIDRPARKRARAPQAVSLTEVAANPVERRPSGLGEFDRVLGGGIVPGSVILLGGEPGIGKSTLLLQLAGALAQGGRSVLVASAEESAEQVALRAQRLTVAGDELLLVSDTDVDAIIEAAESARPEVLVVDSIQAVAAAEVGSAPGSVSQVRESAARLIRYAKKQRVPVILVGHVTKEGTLAGPKVLEHMVDVVLALEGDQERGFRSLRGFKNRFGPTHVVALFDMRSEGMVEVADPSEAFLSEWRAGVPGTVVFPSVEGRRSVCVEVQALVAPSPLPQPRRSVRGFPGARVHQIVAVLQRHAGLSLADREIYVNIVGGWRIEEPGADLPVALALASSVLDLPLGSMASWGEVGLAGEIRPVPFHDRRAEEVARLGVERILAPEPGRPMGIGEALFGVGLGAAAPREA